MARTTEAEIKKIISTTLTNEQVTPFLISANLLVTDVLSGEGYSAELLREIERWLAAHFLAVRDPQITEEKIGDARARYQGKTGLGLEHTSYGQQAMVLDHHGLLASISRGKGPVEVKVIT